MRNAHIPSKHAHHDGDLKSDMEAILSRRKIIAIAGIGAVLAACDGMPGMGQAEANSTAIASDGATCIKLPAETQGPFPADGTNAKSGSSVNVLDKAGIIREDIRPSFDGLTDVAEGVPTVLELQLVDVSNACKPLANHVIYIWQCDAAGSYSIYERANSNNLRGAAITDAGGIARFTTIFPGCYRGRWPHIHFEVFADKTRAATGDVSQLTSQFAFAKSDCEAAYAAHPAYVKSPANLAKLSLETDGIFANNTKEQLAAQTLTVTGTHATTLQARARIGILTLPST